MDAHQGAPAVPISLAVPLHPYYPLGIELLGYAANEWSTSTLLTIFFSTWALLLVVTFSLMRAFYCGLSRMDKGCVLWFVSTGVIHVFFEGYFAVNHYHMLGRQDILGQLWKEYAHGDSRYMTSDAFVLCMESVTAFLWGPLSLLSVFLILSNSPYRHPVQALVSLGQIYGLVLYYATSTFDEYYSGTIYSRPEFLYFWFYYVIMNAIWMLIPGACLYSSITESAKAFSALDDKKNYAHANGNGNGHADPSANGHANGHANGSANNFTKKDL